MRISHLHVKYIGPQVSASNWNSYEFKNELIVIFKREYLFPLV